MDYRRTRLLSMLETPARRRRYPDLGMYCPWKVPEAVKMTVETYIA